MNKKSFVDEVIKQFGDNTRGQEDFNVETEWLAAYVAKKYKKEFTKAASKSNITCIRRQTACDTAAMLVEAKVSNTVIRAISKHLKAHVGKPLLAIKNNIDKLTNITYIPRRYEKYKFKSAKGKKCHPKVQRIVRGTSRLSTGSLPLMTLCNMSC
eukprot:12715275-Ditylum_brightwellii.AAC.1